jgi:hypothetical protein
MLYESSKVDVLKLGTLSFLLALPICYFVPATRSLGAIHFLFYPNPFL